MVAGVAAVVATGAFSALRLFCLQKRGLFEGCSSGSAGGATGGGGSGGGFGRGTDGIVGIDGATVTAGEAGTNGG